MDLAVGQCYRDSGLRVNLGPFRKSEAELQQTCLLGERNAGRKGVRVSGGQILEVNGSVDDLIVQGCGEVGL